MGSGVYTSPSKGKYIKRQAIMILITIATIFLTKGIRNSPAIKHFSRKITNSGMARSHHDMTNLLKQLFLLLLLFDRHVICKIK